LLRLKTTLAHKGLILVSVPLFFSSVFILILYGVLEHTDQEMALEARNREVLNLAGGLATQVVQANSLIVNYWATKNPALLEQYQHLVHELPVKYKQARALVKDDARAVAILDENERTQNRAFAITFSARKISAGREMSLVEVQDLRLQLQACAQNIILGIQTLTDELKSTSGGARSAIEVRRQLIGILLPGGLIINIAISLLLATYFAREVASRLTVMCNNARRFSLRQELSPPVSGGDEIAQLDRSFHTMVDTLSDVISKERALIDNAVDVICTIDGELRFSAVSNAVLKAWGYPAEDLVGMRVINIVTADDADRTLASFKAAFANAGDSRFDNRIIRKDGATIEAAWSLSCSPLEQTLFCVVQDVSERKRAENLLKEAEERGRSIMESVPVALIGIDDQANVDYVNGTFEAMTGFTQNEIIGLKIEELFLQKLQTSIETLSISEIIDSADGTIAGGECATKSGGTLPIEVSVGAFPLRGQRKRLASILDVRERQHNERIKREFQDLISESLRTPLASLQNAFTGLESGALGPLSDRGKEILSISQGETARLLKLTEDLLNLDKLGTGRFSLSLSEASLVRITRGAINSIKRAAELRNITLAVACPELGICCDSGRIIQVLINLLSNAIKFSSDNGTIRLSVDDEGDLVRFTVADQGRGVPAEYTELIFEKFHQVDADDARQLQGTGLGLPICKTIVEQHGGTIGVVSEPEHGSTFWFTLPKRPANAQ